MYKDLVLVITKYNFIDHLKALEKLLQKPAEAGLKIDPEKTLFGKKKTEYLILWVRNNRVIPLSSE